MILGTLKLGYYSENEEEDKILFKKPFQRAPNLISARVKSFWATGLKAFLSNLEKAWFYSAEFFKIFKKHLKNLTGERFSTFFFSKRSKC